MLNEVIVVEPSSQKASTTETINNDEPMQRFSRSTFEGEGCSTRSFQTTKRCLACSHECTAMCDTYHASIYNTCLYFQGKLQNPLMHCEVFHMESSNWVDLITTKWVKYRYNRDKKNKTTTDDGSTKRKDFDMKGHTKGCRCSEYFQSNETLIKPKSSTPCIDFFWRDPPCPHGPCQSPSHVKSLRYDCIGACLHYLCNNIHCSHQAPIIITFSKCQSFLIVFQTLPLAWKYTF